MSEDTPPGTIDQHRIERGPDPRELGGHVPTEPDSLAEVPGVDPPDRPLGLGDQGVELVVAPDVERPEPIEELGQVADGRVPEHPGLAVLADARDPLGEVCDEHVVLMGETPTPWTDFLKSKGYSVPEPISRAYGYREEGTEYEDGAAVPKPLALSGPAG